MILIQPPTRRTLLFSKEISSRSNPLAFDEFRVNLPFPYVVFSYHDYVFKAGFCNVYPDENTVIYFPTLPNIFIKENGSEDRPKQDFEVCLEQAPFQFEDEPISEYLEQLVSYFWQSYFVFYEGQNWVGMENALKTFENYEDESYVSSLRKWSKLSVKEILKINWRSSASHCFCDLER